MAETERVFEGTWEEGTWEEGTREGRGSVFDRAGTWERRGLWRDKSRDREGTRKRVGRCETRPSWDREERGKGGSV